MTAPVAIRFVPFAALDAATLHDILKLRFDVFVLEQASIYPEIDGADPTAVHGIASAGERGAPLGVLRLLGVDGPGAIHIGRVAIHPDHRGDGLGRRLIAAALDHIAQTAPGRDVKLGAQIHLERFYGGFGFNRCSGVYDDGGIDHVDMTLTAAKGG